VKPSTSRWRGPATPAAQRRSVRRHEYRRVMIGCVWCWLPNVCLAGDIRGPSCPRFPKDGRIKEARVLAVPLL